MSRQLATFALVGLTLNAALYAAYLALTAAGMAPQAAMTLTYLAGVLIGFLLNRRIVFRFEGDGGAALLRYVIAYAGGYVVDYAALDVFVDRLGFPHPLVQGAMILILAAALFLLQKFWIFARRAPRLDPKLAGPLA
jgi:putative flippase GtrA